jgi:hypothetical protein
LINGEKKKRRRIEIEIEIEIEMGLVREAIFTRWRWQRVVGRGFCFRFGIFLFFMG